MAYSNGCFWKFITLYITLFQDFYLTGGLVYTPSDAYEESLLRPFRSYSDVAIFHFSVPYETKRAMWQFVGFMDDPSCISRTVHIFLRHGSYPVISPDNGSYPESLVFPQHHLYALKTTTSYQPKEMPEFHMINPLPGSWFGVAYIPDWNREIKVQGISHKCHYSLGSMAAWTIQPNIHLLTTGSTLDVVATSQINYFKFFVPEGTWSFNILISNCTVSNSSWSESSPSNIAACVREFGIQPQALPFQEPLNITETELQYSHPVQQPETNLYYYLVIVSDHHSTFNINSQLQPCSYSWRGVLGKRPSKHLYLKEWVASNSVEGNRSRRQLDDEWLTTFKVSDDCLPVISLTRVKHSQDFLDSFLLQGHDWFSSWLAISESLPLLVKFELLPFLDIGGTLQTRISLDGIAQNLTTQVVNVSMCIRTRGSPLWLNGRFVCPEELSFSVASNSSFAAVKYFPFPEPGTWYISFQVNCYNSSSSQETQPCELEQVMVDLSIRLQPCVFEGQPCGAEGFCKENHFRQFYFSTCQCFSGWKGWGCSDGSEAYPPSTKLVKTLLLTLSNAFFLPAILLALRRRFFPEAIVYTVTMFFSTFYHACDVDMFGFCLFKYDVLQFCDFYSAILSVWVTLVAMAALNPPLTSMAHVSGALGIALGVECQRTGLWVFAVPFVIGVTILIISWVRRCYQERSCWPIQPKQAARALAGSLFALAGLVLFAFVETEENYKYVHSAWHMIVAVSIAFLLPAHSPSSRQQIVAPLSDHPPVFFHTPINNDAEMLDIGEYRINSDRNLLVQNPR